MATQLKNILRGFTGVGNPQEGDLLVTDFHTFKINHLYVNKTDGSVWIRKAANGVAADWESMAGEGIGSAVGSPTEIKFFWAGSQAQYDAMVSHDANTIYFIL